MDNAPSRRNGAAVAPAWEPQQRNSFPALTGDITVDTAIVGGGVTGLACALELAERGVQVALVERDTIAAGSTGWCGGVLSISTTLDLSLVENAFGQELARKITREVTQSLTRYAHRFPHTQWQTGSTIYLSAKPRHNTTLREEAAVRSAYGLSAEQVAAPQLPSVWNGFFGGLKENDEHGVNPVLLMQSLALAAQAAGARIFEHTGVTQWHADNGLVSLHTASGVIRARRLILAVGLSGADEAERRRLNRFLVPVVGHVLVTEPSAAVAEVISKHGVIAAWDSFHLYHYMRYLSDGRMLIGGEEKPGTITPVKLSPNDAHIRRLHLWAQHHHNFTVPRVAHAWRASLIFPGDGMPLVQTRDVSGCPVVTVVTDGLPFAFALAGGVARKLIDGEDWLTAALSENRKMTWQARLLSMLPQNKALRTVAHHVAFAAMRVADHV